MKRSGFTLLEVLVAFVILVLAYSALLYLYTLSLHLLTRTRNLFSGVLRLELFLAGETVKGIQVERRTFKLEGLPIQEVIYQVPGGPEEVYFRIYERP